MKLVVASAVISLFLWPTLSYADDPIAQARDALNAGNAATATEQLTQVLASHQEKEKVRAQALLLLGQALERNLDAFNTDAEMKCFRRGRGGARCMDQYAASLNAKYGVGAFAYAPEIVVLRYTGSHYRDVLDGWAGTDFAAEASFRLLEKNVIGKPDDVLQGVRAFLDRNPGGEWSRRGRLLWARLHQDIWWIHRNWAWLLYNWNYSEDELVIRGEKFRKEALRAYEELVKKNGRTEEGKAAKRELELLKQNKDDGVLYGIVNEVMVGKARSK